MKASKGVVTQPFSFSDVLSFLILKILARSLQRDKQKKSLKRSTCSEIMASNPLRGTKLLMRRWRKEVNPNALSFVALGIRKQQRTPTVVALYSKKPNAY